MVLIQTPPNLAESPRGFEIPGDKELIRPEIGELSDGKEVPKHLWEPLFGNEMNKVWDRIIPDDGDELIIKGSSVIRMCFGGYVVNKESKKASPALRSDVDVLLTDFKTAEATGELNDPELSPKTNSLSKKFSVEGVEVGVVASDYLKVLDLEAISALEAWTHELPQERGDYFREKLDALSKALHTATPEQMQVLDNLMEYESLAVKLKREDGEIKAYFVDPNHTMDTYLVNGLLIRQDINGEYFGMVLPNPNELSVRSVVLEALDEVDPKPEIDSWAALWSLEAVPRIMRASSELDITVIFSHSDFEFYRRLYGITKRTLSGEEPFTPGSALSQDLKRKGFESISDWYGKKCKESFARACAKNPYVAYDFALLKFPMAGFFSEEVGDHFAPLHDPLIPSYTLAEVLYMYRLQEGDVEAYLEAVKVEEMGLDPQELAKPLKTFIRLANLIGKKHGGKYVPMESLEQSPPMVYPHDEQVPIDMSETIAFLFAALEWDAEKDEDKIDEVLKNWNLSGTQKTYWQTADSNFDLGVDKSKVLAYLNEIKELI